MQEGESRHVRGIPNAVWQAIRAEAVRRGVTVGELLTEVLREWLSRQKG